MKPRALMQNQHTRELSRAWNTQHKYNNKDQVRVTVGDSGLCCCTCVAYFKLYLTPLCVDSAWALWASFCFNFIFIFQRAHPIATHLWYRMPLVIFLQLDLVVTQLVHVWQAALPARVIANIYTTPLKHIQLCHAKTTDLTLLSELGSKQTTKINK